MTRQPGDQAPEAPPRRARSQARTAPERALPTVALAGNPNSGKTTLFNQLTGARHRIANYPGVTVSHTVGTFRAADGRRYTLIDLPGTYSLEAHSPEEEIAQRVVLGDSAAADTARPDLVCVVVDATNLERNLYLASQLTELSIPTVVALNMMDLAEEQALRIDVDGLSEQLGVPVVPVVAARRETLGALELAFRSALEVGTEVLTWGHRRFALSPELEQAIDEVARSVEAEQPGLARGEADFLARKLLGGARTPRCLELMAAPAIAERVTAFRQAHADIDPVEVEIQARYAWLREVLAEVLVRPAPRPTRTDRADRIVLHRIGGPLILLSVFAVVFFAVFTLASYPMDAIEAGKAWLVGVVASAMSAGELRSLLTDGIIEGVGAVVVFLPQIALLFLLISLLEDFGYLARAAFILDRFLSRVGLSGRAFVPLLSSNACAIPGILATRTIPSRRERFLTILISPLMVCSARLPVYSLLIGAFVVPSYGALAGGLVFVGMYFLGIAAATVAALVLGRTVLRGKAEPMLLELPAYKRPVWRNIFTTAWDRSLDFMKNAGTIILSISIVLWFLAAHPRDEPLESSYAGTLGHAMEPAIEPLGFDWKIGVGLLTSFAAREVFVGTMSTLYGLEEGDEGSQTLEARMQHDVASDGEPRYSLAVALSLLVFFAFACQCMSTLAVVARETRSWRWPLFMFGYMSALAYLGALVVYQGGRLLGLG